MGNEFWFRPKTFGYGATPTTWQGWILTAVYAAVIIVCVAVYLHAHSLSVHAGLLAAIVAATVVMVAVSVRKTDGAWGWNAGRAKQNTGKKY